MQCRKCGYTWEPREEYPKQCPVCKAIQPPYYHPSITYTCSVCGHTHRLNSNIGGRHVQYKETKPDER